VVNGCTSSEDAPWYLQGRHPKTSPPPGMQKNRRPPKGSEVSPSPPTMIFGACCTVTVGTGPGSTPMQPQSPTGAVCASFTDPPLATAPAVDSMAGSVRTHVLPSSRVHLAGTVTSPM